MMTTYSEYLKALKIVKDYEKKHSPKILLRRMRDRFEFLEIRICNEFDITLEDLRSNSRKTIIKLVRQVLISYRRQELKYSFFISASRYHRDHSTAIHSVQFIKKLRSSDAKIQCPDQRTYLAIIDSLIAEHKNDEK